MAFPRMAIYEGRDKESGSGFKIAGVRLHGPAIRAAAAHNFLAEIAKGTNALPYTGTRTMARRPPCGESPSVMSPPCERAMSRAMASPSPVPPSS